MVITICGTGESGYTHGKCLSEAQFTCLCSVCVDPIRPRNLYVGDAKTIRYVDTESDTVSLIAGSKYECHGAMDGVGSEAS